MGWGGRNPWTEPWLSYQTWRVLFTFGSDNLSSYRRWILLIETCRLSTTLVMSWFKNVAFFFSSSSTTAKKGDAKED